MVLPVVLLAILLAVLQAILLAILPTILQTIHLFKFSITMEINPLKSLLSGYPGESPVLINVRFGWSDGRFA